MFAESHSGRLFGTLTRQLQRWRVDPARDRHGRSEGGTQYDRFAVLVVVVVTRADRAQDVQADEIARLDPADNSNEFPDDPPF